MGDKAHVRGGVESQYASAAAITAVQTFVACDIWDMHGSARQLAVPQIRTRAAEMRTSAWTQASARQLAAVQC
jgi:hypothetical protein